jgi:hypothetical protein
MRSNERPTETPSESEQHASHGHSTIRPSSPWATLPAARFAVSYSAPLIRPTSWVMRERRRVGPATRSGRVGSGRVGQLPARRDPADPNKVGRPSPPAGIPQPRTDHQPRHTATPHHPKGAPRREMITNSRTFDLFKTDV